jgi:glutamyl/glutaminyl-tRNA synthetase
MQPEVRHVALRFGGAALSRGASSRMDDTDPSKESQEYVDAIVRDVRRALAT